VAKPIRIPIETPFNARDAQAALRAIQALDRATVAASRASAAVAQAQARQDAAQARSAVSAAKLAQAQAQAGAAAQRLAQAQARTAVDVARAEAAQNRASLAALRLQQAQERAARPTRTLADALGGVQRAAGGLGLAIGAQQLAQFAQEASRAAMRLELTKNSLSALAGSQELYAEAMATARQQQRLFGGSLAENVEGIQGLITVSRSSGVELERLVDISQRLSVKDPAQGIAGARIALNEAMAGDPTSLVRRYEIPRAALAAIRDESISAGEKLAILDQYLADIGITSDVVAGSVPQATLAINDLNAATENLVTTGGRLGTNFAAPFIAAASGLLGGTADFQAAGRAFGEALAEISGASEASAARIETVAGLLLPYITNVGGAAEATFGLSGAIGTFVQAFAGAPPEVQALIQGLTGYIAAGAGAAAETEKLTSAMNGGRDAILTVAEAAVKDQLETEALAATKARLRSQAADAAGAIMASGVNIRAEADRLAASSSAVDHLTAAYLRLAIAQGAVDKSGQGRAKNPGKGGMGQAFDVANMQRDLRAAFDATFSTGAAGAAGGSARVSAERDVGTQILDIAQDTADKLTAIDQRAAEQRAAAAQQLADEIRATAAALVASQEADDLDLIGASEEQAQRLAAREQAQAQQRIALAEATAQAERDAAEQGAEYARAAFDARKQGIDAQAQLDQRYAERQTELAGNPEALAALQTQYQEATAAIQTEVDTRISLAQREAAEKQAAVAAEKQAVLDAAAAQAAALAETGKGARTADQLVAALRDTLLSLPQNVTTTITVNEVRRSGTTSSSASADSAGSGSGGSGGGPVGMKSAGVVGDAVADAQRILRSGTTPTLPTAGGAAGTSSRARRGSGAANDTPATLADQLRAERDTLALIRDIADLRREINRPMPPLDAGLIQQLAGDSQRVATIVRGSVLPATEEQNEALGLYADAVGDSVRALRDAGDLSSRMFIDYTSPSDAQLSMLATDAQRTVTALRTAAGVLDRDGSEAASAYATAVNDTFGAFTDGLRFFDALRSGDFQLNTGDLATFEQATRATLATMARLGADARAIPQGDIAALQTATAALSSQSESLIRLAAVPFADLPRAAGAFGAGGGVTIMPGAIQVTGAPGMDAALIANQVLDKLTARIGSRR
jgi:hypothetical protein